MTEIEELCIAKRVEIAQDFIIEMLDRRLALVKAHLEGVLEDI